MPLTGAGGGLIGVGILLGDGGDDALATLDAGALGELTGGGLIGSGGVRPGITSLLPKPCAVSLVAPVGLAR